eukprot:TRINITY_DN2037_c0_g1_i1.p1 TRINITY_DN2037_c0_g1~~TRINITY_DN2037_c0_g1_i1.p1  ORF type:complete len:211 (-),score=22.94 TRINITY_DN2037_c0_g1_i1:50-682(-)
MSETELYEPPLAMDSQGEGEDTGTLASPTSSNRTSRSGNRKKKKKKKTKRARDGVPISEPVPKVMHFESWYYEGKTKHYLGIDFNTDEEVFDVTVGADKNPFTLVVVGRDGLPLQCWDLHINAILDIMGKPTTLKRCDPLTQKWLDTQARYLNQQVQILEEKLHKFTSFRVKAPNPMDSKDQYANLGGKIRLRSLVRIYSELREKLDQFL